MNEIFEDASLFIVVNQSYTRTTFKGNIFHGPTDQKCIKLHGPTDQKCIKHTRNRL